MGINSINGLCICGKKRHKSKGSADAQIRALIKLQDLENGKKDFKNPKKLHPYRSRSCEEMVKDGKQVWHVGHR